MMAASMKDTKRRGEFCKCGKRRTFCKIHGGGSLCDCGKSRSQCSVHGGGALCDCGKLRSRCKIHGGGAFCECGKERPYCKIHGGSAFCKCGKQRSQCSECNNFVCELCSGRRFSRRAKLLSHMRTKHGDSPKALTKSKELEVYQLFQKAGVKFSYQHHLPFKSCGLTSETSCAYVDFVVQTAWGAIALEVDEEQHTSYAPMCDVRRDFDIAASVSLGSGGKLVILRYNPDPFKVAGATYKASKKERHAKLLQVLSELQTQEPELPFSRLFLYYDRATPDSRLPTIAAQWEGSVPGQLSQILA
jgi:hypothetical protein